MYSHDISRALGDSDDAAAKADFATALARTNEAVNILRARTEDGSLPLLNLPGRQDDIPAIEEAASRIARGFKTLIVIGMGGSSYGGMALTALARNPFALGPTPRIHFLDNIDPHTAAQLLGGLDFATSFFVIVSKSGDTAETLSHALILTGELEKRLGKGAAAKQCLAITEPKDSALTRLAQAHAIPILAHDPDIGGRFSALTNVGLLPAKVAGLDIRAVRRGAERVLRETFSKKESEPARGAAIHTVLERRGRSLAVLMPYCDRLDALNVWYCQLWAESLGKSGHGTTPLRSLGACDQHSQLQLYLDGPRDKFITLILLRQAGKGPVISATNDAALAYLKGAKLGDLMEAEQRATMETLTRNGCPVRVIGLEKLDEETLGALMMHFMLETMIMGELLKVNTFDQPAVEEAKRLAREYLAKR